MATIDLVRSTLGQVLQLGGRQESLGAESALLGSIPELDSMAVVSLIAALEEQFGIMIDDVVAGGWALLCVALLRVVGLV